MDIISASSGMQKQVPGRRRWSVQSMLYILEGLTFRCKQNLSRFTLLPLKSYLPLFATFFRNMKSCQNLTRFDLGRLFAMHIAQKNSEVRHSILHVDLIPITRLVGYLVLQLEKSDSKI